LRARHKQFSIEADRKMLAGAGVSVLIRLGTLMNFWDDGSQAGCPRSRRKKSSFGRSISKQTSPFRWL
jgi:hypothetical protein